MQIKFIGAIVACFILSGCENYKSQDRYQLVSSANGAVFRLDKQTGDVVQVTDQGLTPIGKPGDPLGILGGDVAMPEESTVGKYKVKKLPEYCSQKDAKNLSTAQLCSCISAGFDSGTGRCK